MTNDEFKDKMKALWNEYNTDDTKDFLLTVIEFDENDKRVDILVTGYGCPCCIITQLVELADEGKLQHHSQRDERIH